MSEMTPEERKAAADLLADLTAAIGSLRRGCAALGVEMGDQALAAAVLRLPAMRKVVALAIAEAQADVMGRVSEAIAWELEAAAAAGATAERAKIAAQLAEYRFHDRCTDPSCPEVYHCGVDLPGGTDGQD